MSERAQQLLLELADDELILGWRDSEWTGIAPLLEEDVAFSSIAQNEIGHARALYELAAAELGTTADELAFDRRPRSTARPRSSSCGSSPTGRGRSRGTCCTRPPTQMRLERCWSRPTPEVAGLAAKIDREEVYHRMHARDVGAQRLRDEPRFRAALERAVAVRARPARAGDQRALCRAASGRPRRLAPW